jgi:hypothetical protein
MTQWEFWKGAVGWVLFCWVLVWCAGCADAGLVIRVDRSFSDDEVQQIQEAADAWADASGGVARFEIQPGERVFESADRERVLIRMPEEWALRSRYAALQDPSVLGLTTDNQVIIVPSRCAAASVPLREVVFHEFGHELGLYPDNPGGHSPDPRDAMYRVGPVDPRMVSDRCLGPGDLAQLARRHLLGTSYRECP